jgi:hypothetical protein
MAVRKRLSATWGEHPGCTVCTIGIHDIGELAWKLDIPINVVTARPFHFLTAGLM